MFTGAHIISGNVFEPRALNELIPNWRDEEVHIDFLKSVCVQVRMAKLTFRRALDIILLKIMCNMARCSKFKLIRIYLNTCAGTNQCWRFF